MAPTLWPRRRTTLSSRQTLPAQANARYLHKFRSPKHLRRLHVVAKTGLPSDVDAAKAASGVMVRTRNMEDVRCSFHAVAQALCAAWRNCGVAPRKKPRLPEPPPPEAPPPEAPKAPRAPPPERRRKRLPGTPGRRRATAAAGADRI